MKFLPAIVGSIAIWLVLSQQQPMPEGTYGAVSPWLVKLLTAAVPIVISLLQGGKFDWKSILSTIFGVKIETQAPSLPVPAPVPTPDDDTRPVLSLLRRLIDLFVAEGRFSEANEAMDLYKSCCEQTLAPVEAKR